MKRLFALICCLWLSVSCTVSGVEPQSISSTASPVWQVESKHGRMYLAGTIHVLRASDYPLPPTFDLAYEAAELVAFETDLRASQTAEFSRQFARQMMLPAGTSLEQLLNQDTLLRLQNYLQDNQLSIQQFANMKPAMIALSLTLRELAKLGAGSHGVDHFYFTRAVNDGKKIHTLESLQQQLKFLSRMGEGQENLLIEQTLDDIQTLQTLFNDIVSSWRNGDIQQLEALFIEPMQQNFEPIYQQMLVTRNHNWLPQLIEFLNTPQTEMVLVGSAHLLGQDGLLELLRQQGYTINQLE